MIYQDRLFYKSLNVQKALKAIKTGELYKSYTEADVLTAWTWLIDTRAIETLGSWYKQTAQTLIKNGLIS